MPAVTCRELQLAAACRAVSSVVCRQVSIKGMWSHVLYVLESRYCVCRVRYDLFTRSTASTLLTVGTRTAVRRIAVSHNCYSIFFGNVDTVAEPSVPKFSYRVPKYSVRVGTKLSTAVDLPVLHVVLSST